MDDIKYKEIGRNNINKKRKIFFTLAIIFLIPLIICALILFALALSINIYIDYYYAFFIILFAPLFIFFFTANFYMKRKLNDDSYLIKIGKKIYNNKNKEN